eukprot:s8192_g2.t1
MSSWAQQREAIRRAAQGGVRARTNAQGSQRLPLANNRLREVLLSRPNGELTRAGQFYYGLVGGRPPSRQFDEEQPLIREGPTDYILLRSGLKKPVRSLQPDGNYHLTKLGKSFFREKYTDWLAHVPVRITGTRQRGRNAGRPYQRDDFLPITVVNGSLSRQSNGLSDQQAHARVKEAALRQLDNPSDGDPIMEVSQEVYRYDATRDWAFSKQTLEVVDNRAQVQVSLRQPMGALREISYQLYNGSEILPSAFEARDDKLCVARQLAELLQLPLPEVLSDFDAICDKGWEQRGITALEIREFCAWRGAPMFFVSCRGELLDAYQPPVKENRAVAFTCYQAHAYFYKSARAVSHCDDVPRNEGLYRGDRKASTVPPFSEWRPWAGCIASGHFWAEDLRQVRAALLAQGHQPKVTMRSLCDWRALRLRVRDAPDCVVTQYPEDAEVLQAWMQKLGLEYRGQRLAGAAAEAFQHLLKARRLDPRGSRDRILEEQNYQCKLCSAPIELGCCEFDHVVPVHQALEGQPQVLQALCLECHRTKTLLESSRTSCLESRVCRSVHEAYVQSPRPPALVCKLAKCDPDRICHGVDVVRCRKNALANATFPLPVFSPLDSVECSRDGHLADLTYVDLHRDDRQALLRRLPYLGRGWYSKPAAAYLLDTKQATWADFKWSLDATAHVEPRCLAQALEAMEDAWPEGEEHMAKLSVNALIGLWARNQELDGTPVYRFEECKRLEGEYREPRIEAPYLTSFAPEWRSVEDPLLHCLNGKSLLLSGMPGTGKTHLARQIVAQLCELGEVVKLVSKTHCSVQNLGAGAQTADRFVRRSIRNGSCELDRLVIEEITQLDSSLWADIAELSIRNGSCELDRLVIEEITQLDSSLWADIAELSLNPKVKFLLLGDFRQLPAVLDAFGGAPVTKPLKDSRLLHDLAGGCYHELSENHRSDEAIFGFLRYLRVDEAEEPPLREALQLARESFPRRGQPDTCLVISHANRMRLNEQHNRRLAPENAVTITYEGRAAAGTNAPQTMRVWPGLRLVGAGGKVAKGCFVSVAEAGPDAVRLDTGERFTHAELLRHTRLCHAITYASCQGLTLQGRVHLCDTSSPHFELRHLYVGASRATSAELLSVL